MNLQFQSRTSEIVEAELSAEENEADDEDIYENTSRGIVKGSLLINYMRSGVKGILAMLVPLLFLATQFCVSLNDWYIPVLYVGINDFKYYSRA